MEQPASSWLAGGRRVRAHGIGVIEVVVRMNVGLIQHSTRCASNAGSVDDDLRSQRLVEVWIHHREGDALPTA